jgi:hypothetical protein
MPELDLVEPRLPFSPPEGSEAACRKRGRIMKTLERRACSLLHYATAVLFAFTPVLSGTAAGGPQTWVPLGLGALMAGVTFVARDRIGPARSVCGSTRQNVELAGSTLLVLSPWLFGFAEVTWRPHLLVGQVGIGVSILTRKLEEFPVSRLLTSPWPPGSGPQGAPQAQSTPSSRNRAASALSPSRRSGP